MIYLVLLNTLAIIVLIITIADLVRTVKTLRIRQDKLESSHARLRDIMGQQKRKKSYRDLW